MGHCNFNNIFYNKQNKTVFSIAIFHQLTALPTLLFRVFFVCTGAVGMAILWGEVEELTLGI
jgi:hypothetical protein